jgi:hypothetical protein
MREVGFLERSYTYTLNPLVNQTRAKEMSTNFYNALELLNYWTLMSSADGCIYLEARCRAQR